MLRIECRLGAVSDDEFLWRLIRGLADAPGPHRTWQNCTGATIADLRKGETMDNHSPGITAFSIPMGKGLTNQEAQVVDQAGGVHVLNRDMLDGEAFWRHYHRSSNGELFPAVPKRVLTANRSLDETHSPPCTRSWPWKPSHQQRRGPVLHTTRPRGK